MPHVTVNGASLHYQQTGTGPDVVLLHALTGNLSVWLFINLIETLARDFRVTYADGAADGTLALRLDPKQKQRDYDWLILGVDARTLQIRSLTAADQQGGRSTFQFSNYRENTGPADSVFDFKIPKGTDVITR